MKRLSDNHLLFLLPLTHILAVAFSIFTVIAFRMDAVATQIYLASLEASTIDDANDKILRKIK